MKIGLVYCFMFLIHQGTCQPSISTEPADGIVEAGQQLNVTCTASNAAFTPLNLYVNGVDATGNGNITAFDPVDASQIFKFTYIKREDNGLNVSCLSPESGGTFSSIITLQVLYGPTITNIMDGAGYEEETAIGTFSVDSNPPVTSDDITIMPPDREPAPTISVDGSTVSVTFETLERSDADSYTVTVTNEAINTTDSITLSIDVYYGPTFANVQDLVSATVGKSVTFDCIVSESNPSVQSITLTVPGLVNNPLDITANPEYTVDAISAAFNGTVFTCTADNGERTTSQSHTLIVSPTVSSTTPTPSVTPTGTPDGDGGAGRLGVLSVFVLLIIGLLSVLFAQ